MAESGFSSASESDEELGLEVLSGYVKTIYESVKGKLSSAPNGSLAHTEHQAESGELSWAANFHKVVANAAKALDLNAAPFEPVKPKLARLATPTDRVLLPLDEAIVKQCQAIWEKPASATPVHKAMDRKYRVPKESSIHCFSHPPADSAVVKAASRGQTSSAVDFPLSDSESKVLDSIGKRTYHSGGLSLRQANLALVLARYNKHLWTQVSDAVESLPEDAKTRALELQKEALAAADASIEIAKDQADVAARVMAAGIVLRRRAWLRITNFQYPFQTLLVDQPFDGVNLFCPSIEELIKNRSKSPAALKAAAAKSPGSKQAAAAAKSPSSTPASAVKAPSAVTAVKTPAVTPATKVTNAKVGAASPAASALNRKRKRKNQPAQE
ncbi:hypothetical protein NDU88_008860 [Pleurodeles waltl]|uniref:Lamina-associated polypeptide 2 alpha C-terminal domain-containing protein n=1 Tax=Pleurodeles waltl TaxID=8319 RepID=A0AAV7NX90_PLEWA|nr:hypothetical protein NDU88_008860 [Pleurodeles waltl]